MHPSIHSSTIHNSQDNRSNLNVCQQGDGSIKCYMAIKRITMPFVTTWMHLEMIILSEVRKRKTNNI